MKHLMPSTLCLLLLTGCLHSYVNVASDPPGARVFFNHEDKGKTPAKIEFLWYGKQKIQLFKEGYQRKDEIVDVKCPPHLYFPLDLFFTAMPFKFEDNHHFTYTLTPNVPEPQEAPKAVQETPQQ
ncbi:MAG TPA: PEGA domain-containing protein [bacterium]|nr:PEGA domain-containing protein [bacterium]